MSADTALRQEDLHSDHMDHNSSRKRAKYHQEFPAEKTRDGGYKIKTYYPTWDQMKDFSAYMRFIHEDGGHRAGLAKIIPPTDYTPRKSGYATDSLQDMEITCPIRQEVTGEGGLFQQMNIVDKKKMTVRNFQRLAEDKHFTPEHDNQQELERAFWKNVFTNPSIYGADVPGSLFDPDFDSFNLTKLNTILDDIQGDYGVTIQGVNTTYLYFGMWKSSFCWHTEDMDLYSINYLHTGAPKSWYCIAPENGRRFERLAESFFPHSFKSCKAFLRHKTTLISPAVLKKFSVPFSRVVQEPGEFMVTFPYSYHSGFNNGYNIAEATNFATEHWIDFGKWATRCECSAESVKISMQTFVKRYQSERYENWIRGKDVCKDPRDPKHVAAAPKPTEHDLFVMGVHDRYSDDPHNNETDQEDDKRRMALQQNQSSNLRSKSRSLKSTFKSIAKETLQRYSEVVFSYKNGPPIDLPHYSAIPTSMSLTPECVPVRPIDISRSNINEPPDYDKIIRTANKRDKIKAKKEEKINQKKEQRARERMIASQELLHFLPVTFTHEKKFNRCIAALPPHCAVCQMLKPHPKEEDSIWGSKPTTNEATQQPNEQPPDPDSQETSILSEGENPLATGSRPTSATGPTVEDFKLPETSKILLSRVALSNHGWANPEDIQPDLAGNMGTCDEEGSSQNVSFKEADSGYEERIKFLDINIDEPYELLQCNVCMLSVHNICYGVKKPASKEGWVCDRCATNNRSILCCALCPCRGGALKSIDSTWVHITCALTLPNVKLTDLTSEESEKKNKIKLPEPSIKRVCAYCIKNIGKPVQGTCLSCAGDGFDGCATTFHPTCGHRHGVQFEIIDHHTELKTTNTMIARCPECVEKIQSANRSSDEDEDHPELEPLAVGAQVVALSKRGSYYDGTVHTHFRRVAYELFFPHANEIDSMVSERNIINLDRDREFKIGDKVLVRLPSGKEMIGKFRRKRCDDSEYLVKFNGATQAEKILRKNIYLNIDQMSEEQIEQYIQSAKKPEDDEFVA